MSIRKFEDKMLKQINQIDEGLATKILKAFMRAPVKRAFASMNASGEMDSVVDNIKFYREEKKKLIQKMLDSDDPEIVKLGKKLSKELV